MDIRCVLRLKNKWVFLKVVCFLLLTHWLFFFEHKMSRNGLRCSSVSPSEALKVIPHPSCRLRVKAARSHYIGGSYGKASEASMREALHLRGPIAASFEPSRE